MKFKEYLSSLNELAEKRPSLLELDVVYSRDDEGNGFQYVAVPPVPGYFYDGCFESEDDSDEPEMNCVCIN